MVFLAIDNNKNIHHASDVNPLEKLTYTCISCCEILIYIKEVTKKKYC